MQKVVLDLLEHQVVSQAVALREKEIDDQEEPGNAMV